MPPPGEASGPLSIPGSADDYQASTAVKSKEERA
jgi:hypothetical protein